MKIRPQYTIEPTSYQIWPLDQWSRNEIIRIMKEANVSYDDTIPTTMGTCAIRLLNITDFMLVKSLLN